MKFKFIQHKLFKKIFDNYVKCKLYYSRASSYTGIPMSIIQDIAIYGTFLKVYLGKFDIGILAFAGLALIFIRVFLGRLDYQNGLAQRETEIGNKYNPDIQYIKRRVKKNGKKHKT